MFDGTIIGKITIYFVVPSDVEEEIELEEDTDFNHLLECYRASASNYSSSVIDIKIIEERNPCQQP